MIHISKGKSGISVIHFGLSHAKILKFLFFLNNAYFHLLNPYNNQRTKIFTVLFETPKQPCQQIL